MSMCVCTILYRCKTSIFYIVQGGNSPSSYVAQRSYGRCGGWVSWTHETCTCNIYIIYIYSPRPWAHLSRSWGGDIYLIAVVFIRSMSTVIIPLSLYIFIVTFHSSCLFIVDVFARPMHFTSEFAMTVLSKCVIHAGFVKVA